MAQVATTGTTTTGDTNTNSTVTGISHTIPAGADGVVVIACGYIAAGTGAITSVDLDGTQNDAFTIVGSEAYAAGGQWASIAVMTSADTGWPSLPSTETVDINTNGTSGDQIRYAIVNITNNDTSTPAGTAVGDNGTTDGSPLITPASALNDLIFAAVANFDGGDPAASIGGTETTLYDYTGSGAHGWLWTKTAAASSTNIEPDLSAGTGGEPNYAVIAVAIKEAGAGGGGGITPLLTGLSGGMQNLTGGTN